MTVTPDTQIRAIKALIKILDKHTKSEILLTPNQIEFITTKFIEHILTLEEISNEIFEDSSEQDKKSVLADEEERNRIHGKEGANVLDCMNAYHAYAQNIRQLGANALDCMNAYHVNAQVIRQLGVK